MSDQERALAISKLCGLSSHFADGSWFLSLHKARGRGQGQPQFRLHGSKRQIIWAPSCPPSRVRYGMERAWVLETDLFWVFDAHWLKTLEPLISPHGNGGNHAYQKGIVRSED